MFSHTRASWITKCDRWKCYWQKLLQSAALRTYYQVWPQIITNYAGLYLQPVKQYANCVKVLWSMTYFFQSVNVKRAKNYSTTQSSSMFTTKKRCSKKFLKIHRKTTVPEYFSNEVAGLSLQLY